jgi:TQXA domain-containing protein
MSFADLQPPCTVSLRGLTRTLANHHQDAGPYQRINACFHSAWSLNWHHSFRQREHRGWRGFDDVQVEGADPAGSIVLRGLSGILEIEGNNPADKHPSFEGIDMRRVLIVMLIGLLSPLAAWASTLCLPANLGDIVGDDMLVSHPNLRGGQQVYAGTFNGTIDCVTPTAVYCVRSGTNLCYPAPYSQGPNISSQEIVWILNNYYPTVPAMPSELSTAVQRKAAVQLALWHFSDGVDISSGGSDTAVFDAARAIIAAAQTATVPPTPTSLVFTPPPSPSCPPPGSAVTITVTLFDQNGQPMPNVPINWTIGHQIPGSGSGTTDISGQFSLSWTEVGNDLVTLDVAYTIPVGLKWVLPGCQDLIQGAASTGHVTTSWGDCPVGATVSAWSHVKNTYR